MGPAGSSFNKDLHGSETGKMDMVTESLRLFEDLRNMIKSSARRYTTQSICQHDCQDFRNPHLGKAYVGPGVPILSLIERAPCSRTTILQYGIAWDLAADEISFTKFIVRFLPVQSRGISVGKLRDAHWSESNITRPS